MADKHLADEDIANIACGMADNPFALLGFHRLGDRASAAVVRAFEPLASAVSIETGSGEIPMERIDTSGLFEASVPETVCDYKLIIYAHDGARSIKDDAYRFGPTIGELDSHLFLEGSHCDLYKKLGARQIVLDGVAGVAFAVWAPDAYRVSVVGDFNRWDGRSNVMRRHPVSGVWDIFIPGLAAGELYKYEIIARDGRLLPLKADPFAFYSEVRPSTASIVWNSGGSASKKPGAPPQDAASPVSIYEAHLGSWKRHPDGSFMNYRELAAELIPYAKWMGFTHIELLPVTEHPLDASWGYQTTGMFAPTSRFGTPDDFGYFVDACHKSGLGLILDWVGAHFPKDAHGLADFDGRSLYEYADSRLGEREGWGTRVYDFGRAEVVNFLLASAAFWPCEYGIDGLRFDAVASMLYLDYGRSDGRWLPNRYGGNENLEAVDFCRRVNGLLAREFPCVATYAEESTGWPMVSRPASEGGLGFSYKWNMGWMHDTLEYMGRDPIHRRYHHHEFAHSAEYAFSENFVLPLSHDEVVHCKCSLLNKMPGDMWQKFANLRALYAYMWTFPGKKLLFMGSEFAQGAEWSETRGLDWRELENPHNKGVQRLVRDLNALYRAEPALHASDSNSDGFEWLDAHDDANSIFSYVRRYGGEYLVVVANMTPIVREDYRIALPCPAPLEEILDTDSFEYGGSGVANPGRLEPSRTGHCGREFSLALTVPPLAVIILKPINE